MYRAFLICVAISLLISCASPGKVYDSASALKYEQKPNEVEVLKIADPMIRAKLKDPDSLKNLKISDSFKCYASNMKFTDNVSPKYDYGYWCYEFSYNATNSYGGYVRGSVAAAYWQGQLHPDFLGDVVRKSDDVWKSY